MKKLVIPVIALLIVAPPIHAGSVWLIMKEADYTKGEFVLDIDKVEMESMQQCEEQGAIYASSERMGRVRPQYTGFECLEGK